MSERTDAPEARTGLKLTALPLPSEHAERCRDIILKLQFQSSLACGSGVPLKPEREQAWPSGIESRKMHAWTDGDKGPRGALCPCDVVLLITMLRCVESC